MSTTVAIPDADELCVYCESRIFDHDPICVRDCDNDCGSPSTSATMRVSPHTSRKTA